MSLHYLGKREPGNCVLSVMLGIRWDHPRRRIEMRFCTVGGLHEIVRRFECRRSKFALSRWFGHVNWFGEISAKEQNSIFHSSETAQPILMKFEPHNYLLKTSTTQNFISIRRRGWSRRTPCMTEKTQLPGVHVSTGSADTLVRTGGIANHH